MDSEPDGAFTPQEHPLAALGRRVGDFLLATCSEADVAVAFEVHLDPEVLAGVQLVDGAGALEGTDLTIAIPPNRSSPPLPHDLSGGSTLVPVDDRLANVAPGIFVTGDAAPHRSRSDQYGVVGCSDEAPRFGRHHRCRTVGASAKMTT